MPATIRTLDFGENENRVWESGEHEGCKFESDRHFHVRKPKGESPTGGERVRAKARMKTGGSKSQLGR